MIEVTDRTSTHLARLFSRQEATVMGRSAWQTWSYSGPVRRGCDYLRGAEIDQRAALNLPQNLPQPPCRKGPPCGNVTRLPPLISTSRAPPPTHTASKRGSPWAQSAPRRASCCAANTQKDPDSILAESGQKWWSGQRPSALPCCDPSSTRARRLRSARS